MTLATAAISIFVFSDQSASVLTSLITFPIAMIFATYAAVSYRSRREKIQNRDPGPYDDGICPIILSSLLIALFAIGFVLQLSKVIKA